MYSIQPKKMMIVNILKILQKYSNRGNPLSQKQIMELLKAEYGMSSDRKSVKRNLMELKDAGYDIRCREEVRMGKSGEEVICTDWFMDSDFDDSELRIIIDSLLYSRHIPNKQCNMLIDKLEKLSSSGNLKKVRRQTQGRDELNENMQFFLTVDMLNEAIGKNKQVEFNYFSHDYKTGKLKKRKNADNDDVNYAVSPYKTVVSNGRYYLLGNIEEHDDIAHFRVDRIADIKITDRPSKPRERVEGIDYGMDYSEYVSERIYLFEGESCYIKMRVKKPALDNLIDRFGKNIRFGNETAGEVEAIVYANPLAMRYWALQYAENITVISPQSLTESITAALKEASERYESVRIKKNKNY